MAAESSIQMEKTTQNPFKKLFYNLLVVVSVLILVYFFLLFLLLNFAFGKPLVVTPKIVSVSKFDVSKEKINVRLSTEFSIHNPNKAYDVVIKSHEDTLYYKNIEPLAAATVVETCYLLANETVIGGLQFSTGSNGEETASIRPRVLERISTDLEDGMVEFALKMKIKAEYKSGSFFGTSSSILVCEGLNVQFNKTTGSGKLIGPAAKSCIVEEFRHVLY